MDLLVKALGWISAHLTDTYLMGVAATLKNEYFIVSGLAIPFVWPAIRWGLRWWASHTPWKDDDEAVDRLDKMIQDKVDGRLGLKGDKK